MITTVNNTAQPGQTVQASGTAAPNQGFGQELALALRKAADRNNSGIIMAGNIQSQSGTTLLLPGSTPSGGDWGRSSLVELQYLLGKYTAPDVNQSAGYQAYEQTSSATDAVSSTRGIYTTAADSGQEYNYSLHQVATIDRAPVAMFEHQGELVMSCISRNNISQTPVWFYDPEDGSLKRTKLPEKGESGHYGYSYGDGFHLVPESTGGMIDYTYDSNSGTWTKNDLSHLNPNRYKNLKWGYAYRDPISGDQFLGYGLSEHPGVVLKYSDANGQWETFATDPEMRFPNGISVINDGPNQGTTLVCSSFNSTRLHAVDPDGSVRTLHNIPEVWGTSVSDPVNRLAYLYTSDGKVQYASFDDLDTWQEASCFDANGESIGNVEGSGKPVIHPKTGRMIFPSFSKETGKLAYYEGRVTETGVELHEIARLDNMGNWAAQATVVGDEVYVGSGQAGKQDDLVAGNIYRLDVA